MLQRYKVAQLDINGCEAVEEDANGDYVEWNDLLPVLRAAESLAQMTTSFSADEYPVMVKEALALLDSIKQIDATKGVEG